jgi:hypothetical protein
VHETPTFGLTQIATTSAIVASHARAPDNSISLSTDNGRSFVDWGRSIPWATGAVPFYTCITLLGNGHLVLAGLTRLPGGLPNHTDSQFFVSTTPILDEENQEQPLSWSNITQPMRMDIDSMPKDRMALLADPDIPELFYVAGNADALAWRVHLSNVTSTTVATAKWTKLYDPPDVMDGSIPHGDCRNYAWDFDTSRLLLVSDGGIFAREKPREVGGCWVSLNGDYASLELLSANYDPLSDRYVAGAQDNDAIVTARNSTPSDVGYGFVMGDGTTTIVDASERAAASGTSRLYGTVQFLGVSPLDDDPNRAAGWNENDNTMCGGFCFVQGDKFIQVQLEKYFPEPSTFPFFVHPYGLNHQDPTRLIIWTNGTGPDRPSAFYEFHIPYTVQDKDDIGPPKKILETPSGAMIVSFVSGGYIAGEADPSLILGISTTHLYVWSRIDRRDKNENAAMIQRRLPVTFAEPVTLEYDEDGARVLGPLTHARTVYMAVSSTDSRVIAITGWLSIKSNVGDESIFLTMDAGQTWRNVTGNLKAASAVVGKVRPGGLLLVDLNDNDKISWALLVGTSNGIMITFVAFGEDDDAVQQWERFGGKDFPIVLTTEVNYEPISDRIVAATFGRGIYILRAAKHKLRIMKDRLKKDIDGQLLPVI